MNWSSDQITTFGKLLAVTAKLYDKSLDFDVAKLIVEDLQDLAFEKCMMALQQFRKDPKNKFWPRASDIRGIVNPAVDERSVAIVMARRIDKAVRDHGYMWDQGIMGYEGMYFEACGKQFTTWKEAVLEELGPIGWATISQKGGWLNTRNSANEMDEQGFIAQTRDQIQANMQLERQGIDLAKLEMPKPNQNIGLQEPANILNLLNSKELK